MSELSNLSIIGGTVGAIVFVATYLLLPFWIRKAHQIGLLWDDMNKWGKQKIAGSGGLIVVATAVCGIFMYLSLKVFVTKSTGQVVEILALTSLLLTLAGIGFLDDLLGWQQGGLSRRSRIILVAIAALPLVAINAGKSIISLPLIGQVDLGIFYPLALIPLGIVGAGTTFNFLAGFNGLEAGQGILLISSLSFVAFLTGNGWLGVIGMCMLGALGAFLMYNWYPAQVFPGDVLTYPVGGLIAGMSIMGNFEKVALVFFIPYIFEVILKSRGKLAMSSFGKPTKKGELLLRYEKIYGLTHLGIYILDKLHMPVTEQRVVYAIHSFQILCILAGLYMFKQGIF